MKIHACLLRLLVWVESSIISVNNGNDVESDMFQIAKLFICMRFTHIVT